MGGSFAGKAVIVTGAASGIGAAAAQRFAAEGASVCLADRDLKGAERVAALCAKGGRKAIALEVDVSKAADNQRMVEKAISAFGKVDIAFLNAGYLGSMTGFDAVDEEMFDRVIQTNLYGYFHGIRALYPKIQSGGAIVVTASIAGLQGLPENPAYAASKHGVLGLVRSCSAALAARKVRINAICPGGVSTPMIGIAQSDTLIEPDQLEMPEFRGLSSAQQVAELALFLSSPRASAMTGGSFVVDVGWTAVLGPQSAS